MVLLTGFIGSGNGPLADFCEHVDEPSGYIKSGNYLFN